jgi:phosphatidylinositol 4-kinase
LGWFAYEPEWYDTNYTNFTQCEAQSVSLFVHYLSNVKGDAVQVASKGSGQENGNSLADVVIFICLPLTYAYNSLTSNVQFEF